jgi:hypothetical protein
MPSVLESHYLRIGFEPTLVFEQNIVIAVGIERRIEIYEIARLFVDISPKNIQIIAVVKSVHGFCSREM